MSEQSLSTPGRYDQVTRVMCAAAGGGDGVGDEAGIDPGAHPHLDLDLDTGDRDDVVPGARVREGLPPSYRMRHEPHYVEALVAHPTAARPVPAVAVMDAGSSEPPPPPLPPDAPSGAAPPAAGAPPARSASLASAAASLAEAFAAIETALRDVPTQGRPLRDRVSIELARAEATRGRWLADATAVLQSDPMPALDEVDLVGTLRAVIAALGPESRLSGGAAAIPVPAGTCKVFGDERLLTTAVGASLAAMRAVIEDRGDARKVSVVISPKRESATRTVQISQWAVRVPAAAYEHFFDADWRDHPAGPSGALLLAAARRIALAHGGGLELVPINGGGCCLMLSLPAAG